MKPSVLVTGIFLLIVSAAHFVRVILQWKISVDTFNVPLWVSDAAFILTAVLAIWLWKENKKQAEKPL